MQYGRWYQRRAVPDLDQRRVDRVELHAKGFRLTLQDGEVFSSRHVIVAGGIASFAWRPAEFQVLPSSLVTHTSDHSDLRKLAGKRVLVVGGGQSALESGALLHEGGAEVEVVTRSDKIHWLQGRLSRTLHHGLGKVTRELLYAPTDVGPAGLSRLMARPDMLRRFPRALQDKFRRRSVRPAGARWLVQRLHDVPISLGRSVVAGHYVWGASESMTGRRKREKGRSCSLGTGYHIDISKYEFLAPELVRSIHRCNGYPRLNEGLETSVPGLHIIGAPAAWSFGPLMQFVSGTHYASRALMHSLAGKSLAVEGKRGCCDDHRSGGFRKNQHVCCRFSRTPVGAVVVGGDYQGLSIVRSLGRRECLSASLTTNTPSRVFRNMQPMRYRSAVFAMRDRP